ncbi:unnamed protein product [Amoebophrya sp. A120]|nr:unnamed protein product [Amoebophrya sp. A120]|eukprot:GSA120T00023475001.1
MFFMKRSTEKAAASSLLSGEIFPSFWSFESDQLFVGAELQRRTAPRTPPWKSPRRESGVPEMTEARPPGRVKFSSVPPALRRSRTQLDLKCNKSKRVARCARTTTISRTR